MNTLRDTDEGKARPSVWPVYAMCVVIGLFSLASLAYPWLERESPRVGLLWPSDRLLQYVGYVGFFMVWGVLGIVAAVGAARFRPWAWWCAGAWILIYALWRLSTWPIAKPISGQMIGACVLFIGLVLWLLATRRRLFFPPKPEGEE